MKCSHLKYALLIVPRSHESLTFEKGRISFIFRAHRWAPKAISAQPSTPIPCILERD